MRTSQDGNWDIAESTDIPDIYQLPRYCLRCGTRVIGRKYEQIHDEWHEGLRND